MEFDTLNEYINNYKNIGRKIFSDQYLYVKNIDIAKELSYKETEKWAYEHTDKFNVTCIHFYKYVVYMLKEGIEEELKTFS